MAVPTVVLENVLQHFIKGKNLRLTGHKESKFDEHRAFFVWRRAMLLGDRHSTWVTEQNNVTLKNRIESEFLEVENFISKHIGTLEKPGPLLPALGGSGDITPNHLDLSDLAHQRTDEDPNSQAVRGQAKRFSKLRWLRAWPLVWRIAALQDDVWKPATNNQTATLRLDNPTAPNPVGPITEYLDRRLRVIERMHFNIADFSGDFGAMGQQRWKTYGPTGPWKDSFRVRIIEYPRLPSHFEGVIGAPNIADPRTPGLVPPSHDPSIGDPQDPAHPNKDQHWNWSEEKRRLEWRVQPATATLGHMSLTAVSVASDGVATFTTTAAHNLKEGFSIQVFGVEPDDYNGGWIVKSVPATDKFTADIGATPASPTKLGYIYRVSYPWRIPPKLRRSWRANPGKQFRIDLVPNGQTGAQAIDQFFAIQGNQKEDVWERPWIWCDHAIAACHIEGLLFGLRRRFADGESRFNKLVNGSGPPDLPDGALPPYVALTSLIGVGEPVNKGILMAHDKDRHFENTVIDIADLQVGDQLIFWNHILYSLISTGDWRLENALVMDLESDPRGDVRKDRILLQGHGTDIRAYALYQQRIVDKLAPALTLVREEIRKTATAQPKMRSIPWRNANLVKWSPYDNFKEVVYPNGTMNVGAWWVEVPLKHDFFTWDSVAEAVKSLPKAIGHGVGPLAAPGSGYKSPPNQNSAIYFPLFEPQMSIKAGGKDLNGWDAWLEKRRTSNISVQRLHFVKLSGSLVPGIFIKGDRKVAIVRPKALLNP
jgi:hypothetical protein